MKYFFAIALTIAFFLGYVSAAKAETMTLVPCKESAAFVARQNKAPDSYYFNQPYKAYSEYLSCGEDGLPHLRLQVDRAVDIAIPFILFFYIAGFIGWSGRAYLQSAQRSSTPEREEIFINFALAIPSFIKGLLWPLLFIQELMSGQLTAKEQEISVSPR